VKVFPSLVKRRKTHFHNLPCGASIILGNNGFIWICPTVSDDEDNGLGRFAENLLEVRNKMRLHPSPLCFHDSQYSCEVSLVCQGLDRQL
jgi:exosome complex RNA-binding protein Rrp4